jgi:hypothetical protein
MYSISAESVAIVSISAHRYVSSIHDIAEMDPDLNMLRISVRIRKFTY